MSDFLWVEKYRPKTIEECILPANTKKTASVLFDNYSPWEKLVTFKMTELKEGGNIPKSKNY